jgi:two-component system NtrC family response regulator
MNKRRFPPRRLNPCSLTISSAVELQGRSLHQAVAELEQRMIRETLAACRFNQVQTAKRLGLSRQGLIKKIKRYHIES